MVSGKYFPTFISVNICFPRVDMLRLFGLNNVTCPQLLTLEHKLGPCSNIVTLAPDLTLHVTLHWNEYLHPYIQDAHLTPAKAISSPIGPPPRIPRCIFWKCWIKIYELLSCFFRHLVFKRSGLVTSYFRV